MRLNVALLRNIDAEIRAKEKAEAPTVKTKEQIEKEEASKARQAKLEAENPEAAKRKAKPTSVWRRKFRPLPEGKAVDLFADVIGDAFILGVASAIIVYEYWKASQKPDQNAERIKQLDEKLEELTRREEELARLEEQRTERYLALEAALRELRDPKTKKPVASPASQRLVATKQATESRLNTHDIALPLPQQGRVLRLVLLSPRDGRHSGTEQRLDRLYHLNGGRDAAIIFLLDRHGQEGDPVAAFTKLQIEMLNKLELPLIPLSSVAALSSSLSTLRASFSPPHAPPPRAQASPFSLLQYLARNGIPLSEHSANLLSELGRSPREIAALVETEEGRARIVELLGPRDGARVLAFMAEEHLILT
ncbi:hypothetical protein CCHL11_08649 [Colletotrichum chlorophyti]|uniref:OPA3-like protein n=1 Tax=Colletotrichum chlorophyti TaxID=708187 RepID=A0A1Q8RCD3_9PEZI|nr:hypothetical protein CCHL11_08649 [Colletotrichum chlorophyti]